jgi:hypothetical protein
MTNQMQISESPDVEQLKPAEVVYEILHGFGIALGLALLWAMEAVRDRFFRLLDRLNVKPRIRRASAFPPGQPGKRSPERAS